MSIKSLLAQKRTKVLLTFLYFTIALLLLLLTWMQKIAIGSFAAYVLLWLGVLLWKLLRQK
jgi:hypothetical protein